MLEAKEVIEKIKGKAKNFKFHAERGGNASNSLVVKEMEICTSPAYPDFMFVIFSNMIFKGGKLDDSSYSIYVFDMEGRYVEEMMIKDLVKDFLAERNTITLI